MESDWKWGKGGEREEPRMKARPLAWSVVRLVIPFAKMGSLEEKQDWGRGGGRVEFGLGHVEIFSCWWKTRIWSWECSFGSHCSVLCVSQQISTKHL
jgi:hypothetical protein